MRLPGNLIILQIITKIIKSPRIHSNIPQLEVKKRSKHHIRMGHEGLVKGTSHNPSGIGVDLSLAPSLPKHSQWKLARKFIKFPPGWYVGGSLGQHNSLDYRFFLRQNPVIETELCIPNERLPEKWGKLMNFQRANGSKDITEEVISG